MIAPDRTACFEGCLLGVMTGDSMGGRVESTSFGVLRHRYPGNDIKDMHPGRYGSTTEMTLALAESLAIDSEFDGADFARRLCTRCHDTRSYGQGTLLALGRLRGGSEWNQAGAAPAGRGCYGNAAAARSAPIGLLYGRDVDTLRWVAEEAAGVTHTHALGVEGAVVFALAVALALSSRGKPIVPLSFLESIAGETQLREYRSRLESAATLAEREWDEKTVVERLGNNQTALGSVVTAIACFACHPNNFLDPVSAAIRLGGNATSIVAMTGALAGARHGRVAIPPQWLNTLERAELSVEDMAGVARALADVHP